MPIAIFMAFIRIAWLVAFQRVMRLWDVRIEVASLSVIGFVFFSEDAGALLSIA